MQLRSKTTKLVARLRAEEGVTMLLALFVLVITSAILSAAYVAVFSDTQPSRNDVDQGRAIAAAQAGIQAYNYQLNQNENYWQTCTPLGNTGAVGFNGTNGNGFVTVPGSTDTGGGSESYYVKPVPAITAPSTDNKCDPTNALTTMIEGPTSGTSAGSFRIASTGHSGNVTRTIVAQYKPPSFLNYVYYTDYETLDPSAQSGDPSDCEVHYPNRGSDCGGAISFITGDSINGPVHSEDTLAICGNPVFGRTGDDDAVEAAAASGASAGWYSSCGSSNPTFNTPSGAINTSSTSITPPSTNTSLLSVTQAAYHFTGKTTIVLSGSSMYVTNTADRYTNKLLADPSNGVVYVSTGSSGCGQTYDPFNPSYTADTNCGNAYVSGTYNTSLTIATDNDIIINGNICTTTTVACTGTPTGNALLGLIANDFVRIYHPMDNASSDTSGGCTTTTGSGRSQTTVTASNATGSLTDPTVYAAILAVNHSFIVDNYNCGDSLGTLNVYGAIAQLFRGTVGTESNGTVSTGYDKSYNYDDRLADEEPPYFLNPVSAQWFVSRQTECNSTTAC
ncbi:MAG TPA: hypothetical protein VGG41_21765 [Solirubrobacteraceae bacterium]|jgi:hypothetical protein